MQVSGVKILGIREGYLSHNIYQVLEYLVVFSGSMHVVGLAKTPSLNIQKYEQNILWYSSNTFGSKNNDQLGQPKNG